MKPSIAVQSDCGVASTTFAKFTGMVQRIAPNTDVVENNLSFETGNARQVAAYLYTLIPFWPENTIFVSLMNNDRKIAVRLANGRILMGSDDGFITMGIHHFGFDNARLISLEKFGDDAFTLARCSASLVNGMPFEEIGEELKLEDLNLFVIPESHIEKGLAEGVVTMLLKTFGNLTFSIETDDFEKTGIQHGDLVKVTITRNEQVVYEEEMTYQPSFGFVGIGAPIIFNGSAGYMDIGLNQENFITECIPEILEDDPELYKVRIEKIGE